MTSTARGAVRPGANWGGWLGYSAAARGPEARRARAEAAGLIASTDPGTSRARAAVNPIVGTPTITVTQVPAGTRGVRVSRSRGSLGCGTRRNANVAAR